MALAALALFPTAIGTCGIAWTERGVAAVALPERTDAGTVAHLRRRVPDARPADPPPGVGDVIARLTTLLEGTRVDLRDVAVDLGGLAEFDRRVYEIARGVPPGETVTYGEVARRLGDPGAAQAVGRALGRNPCPLLVPCHRVLGVGGALVGFSAPGGTGLKRRLLLIEGAPAVPPTLFDDC